MSQIVQIYSSSTPADAVASVLVRRRSFLKAVHWHAHAALSGADFAVLAVISQQSVSGFATLNDVTEAISYLDMSVDLTTSGAAVISLNKAVDMPGNGIPFEPLDRIYLHTSGTALNLIIRVLLHFA